MQHSIMMITTTLTHRTTHHQSSPLHPTALLSVMWNLIIYIISRHIMCRYSFLHRATTCFLICPSTIPNNNPFPIKNPQKSAKWVAKLRELKTDKNDLLLKTDLSSGHFSASDRYKFLKETAFEYSFILDQISKK